MSSARESKWSPQPPNLQALEKKEAAAMPVMVAAALEMRAGSSGSEQRGNSRRTAVGTAGAAGAVRWLLRAASNRLESDNKTGNRAVWLSLEKLKVFLKKQI